MPIRNTAAGRKQSTGGGTAVSVDITNETQWDINPMVFSDLAVWTMDQMHVSTHSDLSVSFIEPEPMAQLHMRWMNLEGPTDVMSFPMDELRPGSGRNYPEVLLGDIILVVGNWKLIGMLAKQGRDFVALNLPEEVSEASPAHSQAPHAIFCLVLMVALMLTDEIPNPVAAIIACLLMGKFRCTNAESA